MVQLEILSGRTAGAKWSAPRFPVRVGRSPGADLRLEEPGVWDEHFHIVLNPNVGFALESQPNAFVRVNGEPAERAALRNGDQIELGAVKLRFWLAEARQRKSTLGEALCWALLAAVCLAQIGLIYWLVRW